VTAERKTPGGKFWVVVGACPQAPKAARRPGHRASAFTRAEAHTFCHAFGPVEITFLQRCTFGKPCCRMGTIVARRAVAIRDSLIADEALRTILGVLLGLRIVTSHQPTIAVAQRDRAVGVLGYQGLIEPPSNVQASLALTFSVDFNTHFCLSAAYSSVLWILVSGVTGATQPNLI
jgi:hypothetical protein